MTKRLLYFFGILVTVLLGTLLFWKFCCSPDCCSDTDGKSNSQKQMVGEFSNDFSLDAVDLKYKCSANFNFDPNGYNHIKPVVDSIEMGIGELKAYLKEHPQKKCQITGYALSSEKNTSAFPSLGEARANDIKNYFVEKGIPASRFMIRGKMVENWPVLDAKIIGPISYKFRDARSDKNVDMDWSAMKDKLNENPLQLNFESGASAINLSQDQRDKMSKIVQYLDNVEGSTLEIDGHTDGEGSRIENLKLGLERATFAKNYLGRNGVNPARIFPVSKGPDEPIADNDSEEGRAMNRRTVVLIK